MKFLDNNIQDYTGTDFNVYKNINGIATMKFNSNSKYFLTNIESYTNVFLGKCENCNC